MTPKRVTKGEAHLHDLATEELSQQWRAIRDTVSNLTGPGIEPQTFRSDKKVFINYCVYWLAGNTRILHTFS